MKVNQIKIGIILSYVSMGINMVIQLLYTPIMLKVLGQSEYGLYTLVASVVSYLSLFSLGFTGAYLRFYTRYDKNNDNEAIGNLNGMFISLFLIMSFVAFVTGMVLSNYVEVFFDSTLSLDELKKAKLLMQILVINISMTFPMSVFDSMIVAHEKFLFQRVVNILGVVFNPLICLPLLIIGYGSVAMVIVTTIITMIKLALSIYYCIVKLNIKIKFTLINRQLLKEIAYFSFFIFLNMIIDQINWSVDKIILGGISGTIVVAVYGVGAHINSLYTMFSTAISSVFAPRINKMANLQPEERNVEITKLFIKVGRIQYMVLGLIITGFIFFGKYFVINIYATNQYKDSYLVAIVLMLAGTTPLIQNLGIEIQRALNKHQFRSIVYIIMAFFNILISIPLAKIYGAVGAAMGTCVSMIVTNGIIINIYYRKNIGIDIILFWKNIIQISRAMIMPALFGCVVLFGDFVNNIYMFIVLVNCYVIVYVYSIIKYGMNEDEKGYLEKLIQKRKKEE